MNTNSQLNNVQSAQLTQVDERKKLASSALKRVDQHIKANEFQKALLEITSVKEIDPTNVYALALEERIKTLQDELAKLKHQKQDNDVKLPNIGNKKDNKKVVSEHKTEVLLVTSKSGNCNISPSNITINTNNQISNKITANELAHSTNASNSVVRKKPTVVLIDDDLTLLEVLSSTIEFGGFDVISLSTSDEAYVLLNKLTPDIIVCDINLETSTMGGFTFYEKIRQIGKLRYVPFVFLTGLNDDALIRTGKEMGVDDYLTKPIKEQNLLASIRGKIKRYEELGLRISQQNFNQCKITSF